jgi:hypothetical protein
MKTNYSPLGTSIFSLLVDNGYEVMYLIVPTNASITFSAPISVVALPNVISSSCAGTNLKTVERIIIASCDLLSIASTAVT